jgi:hypothetical protein
VGVSVGPKGLKVGVDGKGRRYSSVGIPGTGISQRSYQKAGEDGHTPEEYQRALGAGLFLSLLDGRRLRHVRHRRVVAGCWSSCASLLALRFVGRALAIDLRQRFALGLHPDVAVAAEHLPAHVAGDLHDRLVAGA